MTKTNKIFEKCLSQVDPEIKAEVRARADAYIGHPYELDEGADITSKREAYIKGCEDTAKIACDVYADLLSAQGYNPIDVNKEIARMKKAIEEGGWK